MNLFLKFITSNAIPNHPEAFVCLLIYNFFWAMLWGKKKLFKLDLKLRCRLQNAKESHGLCDHMPTHERILKSFAQLIRGKPNTNKNFECECWRVGSIIACGKEPHWHAFWPGAIVNLPYGHTWLMLYSLRYEPSNCWDSKGVPQGLKK